MALTKYGVDVLIWVIVIAVVLFGIAAWTDEHWLRYILMAVGMFLVLFSLNFFRDPDRAIESKGRSLDSLVVCPADGKVVVIEDAEENEFLHAPATQISIFMSPMDVHVNRSPMSGIVEYFRYVKGEFGVAHAPEASHKNERAIIGLNSNGHKILFSQIAGYIARRIICPVKVGDTLHAGERFGMIRFGSRVDIFLPKGARILIKLGEVVRAGETILAELP